ncbi:MAG TPA: hypothetical protein VLR26_16965, partial [Frankiaceae bacterium]|nr:hypothetical protein [Frankiaceae bacterium]
VPWTAPTGRTYVDPVEDHYDDPILSQHLAKAHARERARTQRHQPKPAGLPGPRTDPWNPPADGDDTTDCPF